MEPQSTSEKATVNSSTRAGPGLTSKSTTDSIINTVNDVADDSWTDIQTWHRILGHCNYEDVCKLQDVVEGMQIKWINPN